MKKYINLSIANQTATLPPDGLKVEINKRIADGFRSAGGGLERSALLPCDKNNDAIFGTGWNATLDDPTAPEEKPATLIANGLVIMDGKAQMNGVDAKGRAYGHRGENYKVSLFDGNGDWIAQIGDELLGDLDWSAEVHEYDQATILAGYAASYPASSFGYFPAKKGDNVVVPPLPTPSPLTGFTAYYLYYSCAFIFIRSAMDKIYAKYGYAYDSEFWDTKKGKGLVLPILFPTKYGADFGVDYLNASGERLALYALVGTGLPSAVDLDTQTVTPPNAPNPLVLSAAGAFGTTWQYTAKSNGFYKFKIRMTVNNVSGPATLQFGIVALAGVDAFTISAANDGNTFEVVRTEQMTEGQIMEGVVQLSNLDTLDIIYYSVEIVGEATFGKNTTIDFKYLLRDWKIADFLVGVGQVMNSQWETSVGHGRIATEPLDAYLYTEQAPDLSQINQGFIFAPNADWAQKLDTSKESTDTFERPKNKIVYKYKDDDDDLTVKALQEYNKIGLYECDYLLTSNRYELGEDSQENEFFAATMHIFDNECRAATSLVVPQMPLFWAADFAQNQTWESFVDSYEPRILYFAGQRGGLDGSIRIFEGLSAYEVDLPAAFVVNYNDTSGLDPCLSYADQTINSNTVQGLTRRYYLQSLARRRSSRVRECYFYLTDLDIATLSFRPKIYLDGVWWLLKEVLGYNPLSTQSTKCVLLLDTAENQNDIDSLIHSPILGVTTYL